MEIEKMCGAIEAILFAMGEAVPVSDIASATGQDMDTTVKLIHHLKDRYDEREGGITLVELDDSVQLCTKQEYYEYITKLLNQPKKHVLSDVMLETLSIIAYKQPVTRQMIEKIRGVKCDHAVNKLIEYNLITEVGRLDAPGRPILFGTTEEFLRAFGVNSLDDLPTMNAVSEEKIRQEAAEEALSEYPPEEGEQISFDIEKDGAADEDHDGEIDYTASDIEI